jgi:hypothetical protein
MRAGPCEAHIIATAGTVDMDLGAAGPRKLHSMHVADEHDNLTQWRAAVRTL